MFAKPCDFPTSENVHQFFPFLPSVSQSSLKFSFVSEIEIENRFPQLVFLFTRKKNIDEPGEAWKLKVPTKRLMINTWIARGKRRLMSCDFHCGKESQSHDRPPPPSSSPPGQRSPSRASAYMHVCMYVQVYMWLANGELLPCLPMGSSPRQVHMWCGALLATYAQPTHVFFWAGSFLVQSILAPPIC